jgi:hypothetical protein
MCLITSQREPLIAQEDMRVYKLLEPDYKALYRPFFYELNTLNKTEIKEDSDWCAFDSIDRDYLDENYPGWDVEKQYNLKCLGEGFHSLTTTEGRDPKTYSFNNPKYYVCSIPKGSEYYLNSTGLCISNQIIIKE